MSVYQMSDPPVRGAGLDGKGGRLVYKSRTAGVERWMRATSFW